ncbi:MAG: hypothetical protein A3J06_02265 [Candidatus Moranbacteria bacterium RIFCSPLOWO2_02_FULL_48_19]|nr:MAG: hypothetical protein A3J06_02265 [Candidatus Moranbacteria bacterium RIFCSPLOWO2_02_FULL_48_19]OGI29769.1 MAG: hypothetical protein A3G09_00535 [Candidatus Moranbacteria bacterium RIFCSPLOWO2_12_FULL_48_12]
MIDSIGLGDFLTNIVIGTSLLLSVGIFLFLVRKQKNISWIWLSCSLNAVSFLYFMGSASYIVSIFNIFIWPIINIILIFYYVRKKNQ